jgi:hypothetical protein
MEATLPAPLETQQNDASTYDPSVHLKPWQFNATNARAMALKSQEMKRQREAAAKLAPVNETLGTQLNPLQRVIMGQIQDIDDAMSDCKPKELVAYAAAKATLWKLLFPQPKASRSRRDFAPAEPIEPGQ